MTSSASFLLAVLAPAACGIAPAAPPAFAGTGSLLYGVAGSPPAALHARRVLRAAQAGWKTLEELYEGGASFAEFLARADQRRSMWTDHYESGEVADLLVARARAIGGTWRLLAVAEDWCSDSVNTIPYLALLTERVEGLEMRIIDSRIGREIMESHRTPDGRPATPTILILNEAYEEAGCWIERPAELQAWALENRPKLEDRDFVSRKMAWYSDDGGGRTVSEIVDRIEAASAGTPICTG